MKLLYVGRQKALIQTIASYPSFDVEVVDNGFAAYSYLRCSGQLNLAAIIAEASLPGASGTELAKLLHQKEASSIPFILVDAPNATHDAESLLRQGVADAYGSSIDPALVERRILFLQANLNSEPSKAFVVPEYRIPIVKRLSDIVVASLALLLLSPLLVLVIVAIRLESKGKVYYTSKRVGTGYKIFDFYKLRSMYTGADAKLKELEHLNQYSASKPVEEEAECPECKRLGHPCSPILMVDGGEVCESFYQKKRKAKLASTFVKIKDDPRITRVGKLIRNTSIDELPQLLNVIKGDMSIVGNRPLPLYEAELLTSDQWGLRFMAPAGITGLWQTQKRGGKGPMSEEERKALDNQYALNYSFANDIKIILQTIPALLQKENV